MGYGALFWFLLPCGFACMGLRTGRHGWNCAVTGGCAALALLLTSGRTLAEGWALPAGLLVSLFGDWCLSRKRGRGHYYLLGILGFTVAHVFYLLYALGRFSWNMGVGILGALLLAGYALYLFRWAMPCIAPGLRAAVAVYACISLFSLAAALGAVLPPPAKGLYIAGIALLLFSDTMICESDFMGRRQRGRLIMPTYYACHIALGMSAVCAVLG